MVTSPTILSSKEFEDRANGQPIKDKYSEIFVTVENIENKLYTVFKEIEFGDDIDFLFQPYAPGRTPNNILFLNCKLKSFRLTLMKTKYSYHQIDSISFNNCKTNKIVFDDCSLEILTIENKSEIESLSFINSKIKYVNIGDAKVDHAALERKKNEYIGQSAKYIVENGVNKILIEQNSTIEELLIRNSRSREIHIIASKVNRFYCNPDVYIDSLNLNSEAILERIWLTQSFLGEIQIESGVQIEEFRTFGCDIYDIHFIDCKILQTVEINGDRLAVLEIGTIEAIKEIRVSGCLIQEFNWGSRKPIMLIFNSVKIANANFENLVIPKDTVIQFNDCFINKLKFYSVQNFGFVYFKALNSTRTCYSFPPFLGATKYNVQEEDSPSTILLINSDLGRTSFIGCYLDTFDSFKFFNSKILDVFLAGTEMPERISTSISEKLVKNIYYGEDKEFPETTRLDQQRLGYSQIKKLYENQADHIRALDYRAKELEVYRRQLHAVDKKKKSEVFNLWFMKNTSQYGTNWWLSLKLLLGTLIGAYIIYCLILGNLPGSDVKLFFHNVSYITRFLIPFKGGESLEETLSTFASGSIRVSIARIWADLTRILIAILLYQTLQAFRKHSRTVS